MMLLYSGMTCPFSHSCRFVLHEKGVDFEVEDVDMFKPQDLTSLNPYDEVPILHERELVLYQADVINTYIDERYPHPQLLPPDPQRRARARLYSYIFNREIFPYVRYLERRKANPEHQEVARQRLRDQLTTLGMRLGENKYIMGEDLTLLDMSLAPVLWRLDIYGIELPKSAAPLMVYAERMFSRPSFIDSMTAAERVMRR